MNVHSNARSCPKSRALLVDRVETGWTAASKALGISRVTGHKWLSRTSSKAWKGFRTGPVGYTYGVEAVCCSPTFPDGALEWLHERQDHRVDSVRCGYPVPNTPST